MNRPTDFIPFFRPSLGREEEEAVLRVLRSGWLTTGQEAEAFEQEFAAYAGFGQALAVSSATAGLHLCLEALGVGPGMLVVTSPYTFAASAEVIRYLQADPLFVDIEANSYNIDPLQLEKALKLNKKKIAAIIPVHIAGHPCEMETIADQARRDGIPLVEDAAHTLPVGMHKERVDSELQVYSFYATKPITTGEGGMIVSDRQDLLRRIQVMRLHGIDRDVWDRYSAPHAAWYYQVVEAGYKYNLSDLAAAIGRAQLKKADAFQARNKAIALRYLDGLAGLDYLILPENHPEHCWHLFLLQLREGALRIGRDQFIEELSARGIGVSVHFIPLHIMPYYKKRYGYNENDFPVAMASYRRTVSLPIYPALEDGQVDRVIEALIEIGKRFR